MTNTERIQANNAVLRETIEMAENLPNTSTLIVTVDGEKASHTSKQIYDHIQNGDSVMLFYNDNLKPLHKSEEGEAVFITICDDCIMYWYSVYSDGNFYEVEIDLNCKSLTEEDVQVMIDQSIAKITVYDGETEDIVIIDFTIIGKPCQAEKGMTWGEWVESKYNIGFDTPFYVDADGNIANKGACVCDEKDENAVFYYDIITTQNYNCI